MLKKENHAGSYPHDHMDEPIGYPADAVPPPFHWKPSRRWHNLEGFVLVWYDPTVDNNDEATDTITRFREAIDKVVFYTTEADCLSYIQSIENEKIFFVTTGRCATTILSQVHDLDAVDSVFIISRHTTKYEHLSASETFGKIIGVYNDHARLFDAIKTNVQLAEKQTEVFSFYDKQREESIGNLTKESATFLWFQMFKYMILRLPSDSKDKEHMVQFCRKYYRGNHEELQLLDDFALDNTSAEHALQWYSKDSFVYRLVNKALRTVDFDQLRTTLRVFIADLSSNLAREYKHGPDRKKDLVRLYRGLRMDRKEILLFKQNEGNLLSTNGFLLANRSRDAARYYANKTTKRTRLSSVLVEIECSVLQLGRELAFADISSFSSSPHEGEVLFDIGVTFRILSVQQDHVGHWLIRLKGVNEGVNTVRDFIEISRHEDETTNALLTFGALLQKMQLYDQSVRYFEHLIYTDCQEVDVTRIYESVGAAHARRKEYSGALANYRHVYYLMRKSAVPRTKETVRPLMNIGMIYHQRKEYKRALEMYFKALHIFEKYYGEQNLKTSVALTSIATAYFDCRDYRKGLKYFEDALDIQQTCLPRDHMETATTLNNIAVVCQKLNQSEEALDYYRRSLMMKRRLLPADHQNVLTTLANLESINSKPPRMEYRHQRSSPSPTRTKQTDPSEADEDASGSAYESE